jgi:hypothetical protein
MSTAALPPGPGAVVEDLDPDVLVLRIDELERQQDALRVLFRAARARQRSRPNATPAASSTEEAIRAS